MKKSICAVSEACYLSQYMIMKHMKDKFGQGKMIFVTILIQYNSAQEIKFSVKDFFSKCD